MRYIYIYTIVVYADIEVFPFDMGKVVLEKRNERPFFNFSNVFCGNFNYNFLNCVVASENF